MHATALATSSGEGLGLDGRSGGQSRGASQIWSRTGGGNRRWQRAAQGLCLGAEVDQGGLCEEETRERRKKQRGMAGNRREKGHGWVSDLLRWPVVTGRMEARCLLGGRHATNVATAWLIRHASDGHLQIAADAGRRTGAAFLANHHVDLPQQNTIGAAQVIDG